MSLYDVLDQIVALLQQRQRLTYRLLKREFALDDETLEDLKDELIQAYAVTIRCDAAEIEFSVAETSLFIEMSALLAFEANPKSGGGSASSTLQNQDSRTQLSTLQ